VLLEVASLKSLVTLCAVESKPLKRSESENRQINESKLSAADWALLVFRKLNKAVFAAIIVAVLASFVFPSQTNVKDLEADTARKVTLELI